MEKSAPAPTISFVIPAHNEELLLGRTLESIQQAIQTTGISAEILVVNDASTDRTAEVAKSRNVKVVSVELRNIGAVRNAGAQQANGAWLVFVDADTRVPEQTLLQVLKAIDDGVTGGGATVYVDPPLTWFQRGLVVTFTFVWQRVMGLAAGCFMFTSRKTFEDFGGFDEQYFAAEELYFTREVKQRGRFRLISPSVITSGRKLRMHSTWKLLKMTVPPLFRGPKAWRKREDLDILYDVEHKVE